MSEKTLTERIEQNKRDITRMKQEAYQKGFKEGERRAISEFLDVINHIKDNWDYIGTKYLNELIEKWEERSGTRV